MLHPTNDWIWIDLDDGEISGSKTLESGLHMTADTKSAAGLVTGTVIAVGPGKMSDTGRVIPVRIYEGEKVMFTKAIALQNKIVHNYKEYILIREESIMAVISDGERQVEDTVRFVGGGHGQTGATGPTGPCAHVGPRGMRL